MNHAPDRFSDLYPSHEIIGKQPSIYSIIWVKLGAYIRETWAGESSTKRGLVQRNTCRTVCLATQAGHTPHWDLWGGSDYDTGNIPFAFPYAAAAGVDQHQPTQEGIQHLDSAQRSLESISYLQTCIISS